jgi:thiosulfate dehydrogenase (quinone) large subunit
MPVQRTPDTSSLHQDPDTLASLFSSTRLAPIWIAARVYVGWTWLAAGWTLTRQPDWATEGSALHQTFLSRQQGTGAEITTQLVKLGVADWIGRITAVGLTVAGIAVLLGLATGFAAFIGVTFSVNVLLADSIILGPEVFALAMLLVLAWKTAGWIGLDRWMLPMIGAPWPGGFEHRLKQG